MVGAVNEESLLVGWDLWDELGVGHLVDAPGLLCPAVTTHLEPKYDRWVFECGLGLVCLELKNFLPRDIRSC